MIITISGCSKKNDVSVSNSGRIYLYILTDLKMKLDFTIISINCNCIRYNSGYYDKETSWYYGGRYFDTKNNCYVDGADESELLQYIESYGYNIEILRHINNHNLVTKSVTEIAESSVGSSRASYPEELEVVARVIRSESGNLRYDIIGVATVIRNRYQTGFNGKTTAYDVVTDGEQFSAYYYRDDTNLSSYYQLNMNSTAYNDTLAIQLASDLYYERELSYSRDGINNQLYFCSLKSAVGMTGANSPITGTGAILYKNGKRITNVKCSFTGNKVLTIDIIDNLYCEFGNGFFCSIFYNFK